MHAIFSINTASEPFSLANKAVVDMEMFYYFLTSHSSNMENAAETLLTCTV